MSKDPLEELLFNGCKLTFRSIENGLPVTSIPLCLDAGVKVLYVLFHLDRTEKGTLSSSPASWRDKLHSRRNKHYLLEDCITLANFASRPPPRRPEEVGARLGKREYFFDLAQQNWLGIEPKGAPKNGAPFKPVQKTMQELPHTPSVKAIFYSFVHYDTPATKN